MGDDLTDKILAALKERAAERYRHAEVCHSDRSKKHMLIRADEAGQLVAIVKELIRTHVETV